MNGQRKLRASVLLLILLTALCFGACSDTGTGSAGGVQNPTSAGAAFDGTLSLGDTMPELTVTTAEGETLSVSQLLEKKDLVVLNFWFANCSWCLKEFPVMEVAYQRYKEDVEILAVNPVDSAAVITAFQRENSYSFPMASCSRDLALAFGLNGYPTSVFIDREGKISLIHTGAITDTDTFYQMFEYYTADDYSSGTHLNISEIVR